MKELKSRVTEFYRYKSKQGRSFKVVLKYMHPLSNVYDIRKEIEEYRHRIPPA
jgi:hypothetical protein